MRGEVAFKDIKDVGGLAKSYLAAQRLVGMDKIPIPKGDDPKDWDPVFNKLGRPETADKYAFTPPADLKHFKADDEFVKPLVEEFGKTAHALGLTQKQAAGIFAWYAGASDKAMDGGISQSTEATQAAIGELKKEFGAAFQQKIELGHRAVEYFGGKPLKDFLDETGLGDHPVLVRTFAKMGAELGEDKLVGLGNDSNTLTPDEAKAKIAALGRDENWMKDYQDATRPGHRAAVEERTRLYQFAYPEPEKKRA
jgi:hypothetical protein